MPNEIRKKKLQWWRRRSSATTIHVQRTLAVYLRYELSLPHFVANNFQMVFFIHNFFFFFCLTHMIRFLFEHPKMKQLKCNIFHWMKKKNSKLIIKLSVSFIVIQNSKKKKSNKLYEIYNWPVNTLLNILHFGP